MQYTANCLVNKFVTNISELMSTTSRWDWELAVTAQWNKEMKKSRETVEYIS